MSVIVKLARPVRSIDRDLTSLTFREPTGRDIIAAGTLFSVGEDGRKIIEAAAVGRMIGRLAGITPDAVDALALSDFNACMGAVMGFLVETPARSSTDTSRRPAGGETPPSST
ncbi:MAG: phage tail assembly protein [Acetobacteraceae bacterium]|nr:phage tail assembly protein [Acetobacteraceae bacterium]